MSPEQLTGKIYTAFPEGHFKRKISYDVKEKTRAVAMTEAKVDLDPDVQIIKSKSFALNARFIYTSELFEIELFLFQRVVFPKEFNVADSLQRHPETIQGVLLDALPHIAKIINSFIFNMDFSPDEKGIEEQFRKSILDMKKTTIH